MVQIENRILAPSLGIRCVFAVLMSNREYLCDSQGGLTATCDVRSSHRIEEGFWFRTSRLGQVRSTSIMGQVHEYY